LQLSTKCEQGLVLTSSLSEFDGFRDHLPGKRGKEAAGLNLDILLLPQSVEMARMPIVAPDFGHAQRGIDRKLRERIIADVNLDDDVGGRVGFEIDFSFADNSRRVFDVIRRVCLDTFR
jgi:hypothetical protein